MTMIWRYSLSHGEVGAEYLKKEKLMTKVATIIVFDDIMNIKVG